LQKNFELETYKQYVTEKSKKKFSDTLSSFPFTLMFQAFFEGQ